MRIALNIICGVIIWIGTGVISFRIMNHFYKGKQWWENPRPAEAGKNFHAATAFFMGPIHAVVVLLILAVSYISYYAGYAKPFYRKIMGLD